MDQFSCVEGIGGGCEGEGWLSGVDFRDAVVAAGGVDRDGIGRAGQGVGSDRMVMIDGKSGGSRWCETWHELIGVGVEEGESIEVWVFPSGVEAGGDGVSTVDADVVAHRLGMDGQAYRQTSGQGGHPQV